MNDLKPATGCGRPAANARLTRLIERRDRLALEGRRNLYMDCLRHGIYQWSPGSASFSPETGAQAVAEHERINLGDHNCRIGLGRPFPQAAELPSARTGYQPTPGNWAKDYEFFLANSPAEVNPYELIVGEFHWQLDEVRQLVYPAEIDPYGEKALALGAGGSSLTHTCPDLAIGLRLGWRGVREKIAAARASCAAAGQADRVEYLDAAAVVCRAVSRHIAAYAAQAEALAATAAPELAAIYRRAAGICARLVDDPPATFHEAVQWLQFYQICERMNGHGNGYGRLDQILWPFYQADRAAGRVTPAEARDLLAELYLKYGGNYFSLGGRNEQLLDATNELSWVALQAYDLVGGYNCLGVLWHADIDPEFYNYACAVVHRHGCGTPALLNYDLMRESEIHSGVREADAWNVSYSGCQWYCIVGKEYCDQDKNVLVLPQCLQRSLRAAAANPPADFEAFYAQVLRDIAAAADALVELKNQQHRHQPRIWPEIVCTFMMHDCLEKGLDVTERGTGNYHFTSVNLLGFTNVVDALQAVKGVLFEQAQTDFPRLLAALESDFAAAPGLRRQLLNQPKFGNDDDAVDALACRLADDLEALLRARRNAKGYPLRPSLFQFMGHAIAGPVLGASADGRARSEPFAQGCNPMHGRARSGLTAVANSLLKLPQRKFIGAPWQCELTPGFFRGAENPAARLASLTEAYFRAGGLHVNANIISVADLEKALAKPEDYQSLMLKVTGYSAHFVKLDPHYQREIVKRTRLEG